MKLILDSNDLIKMIKKMVLDTIENAKPCDYVFGEVTEIAPITVKIDQSLTLFGAMLLIPKTLTDYIVKVSIESEEKEITIHNALKIGEKVILLRQKGGQKYFILDRVII